MDNQDRLRPAIFWDRDGTLIEDRGHLSDVGDVVFYPGTINALRRLHESFLFFIVTNQSGVAKGMIGVDDVERINAHVVSQLANAGITISAVYACPHRRTDTCECIKPNPYFLRKAAKDFQVSLRDSYVVGDHPHDVELAKRAGAQGIYVCTGHGLKHLDELQGQQVVVSDIQTAADWILSQQQRATHGGPGHGT
jgi:D-glycero-D-manno-heptose 1,7-bisphosphate phosphatase